MEFTREQLIADDWEVESQPVTITREDFDAAWRRALDVCENVERKEDLPSLDEDE
jgi:hypothetical protein